MVPQVKPRSEILEYGLLPIGILLPRLDSTKSLIELHTKLLSAGEATDEGESVIPVSSLSELLSATEGYAQVLIETFEAVSPDDSPYWENQTGALHVSVQQLSLFLFAQLYGREAVRHESTTNDHWPTEPAHAAECSSPRLGWKSSTPGTPKRQQLAQYVAQRRQYLFAYGDFLRRNLRNVVMLAMDQFPTEPHDQVRIKAAELDRLAFILQIARPAAGKEASPRNAAEEDTISSMLEFFKQAPTAKLDDVFNWLQSHWTEEGLDSPRSMTMANGSTGVKVNRSIGLVGTSGLVDDHSIKGVHRGTVVRGEHDFPTGELHIADCHDAVIYVLAPLRHCLIIGCSECTVIVGAVGSMLRVEGCDKLQVISACVQLVISTCHDCTFWLGINRSPVLIGDNRFITLAPYNTRYERLPVHLREAGVRSDLPNQWSAPIVLKPKERRLSVGSVPDSPRWFTSGPSEKPSGTGSSEARGPVTFMPPEDFMPFVVPFKGAQGMLAGGAGSQVSTKWLTAASSGSSSNSYPFPLPPEYEAALRSKFTFVSELRSKIKAAVLDESRRRELQAVIQLHFKDWLSSSNNIRQVYDLSKLEGDESLTPH